MLQTAFNHGIWCNKLNNRSDLDSYKKACRQIENFEIYPHGGITFRPGFEYKMNAISNSAKSILIPYQHSGGDSYILEVGVNIIRIYSGTTLKDTVTTNFSEAMLDSLDWVQAGDELYFTSQYFSPSRLIRDSDTSWDFVKVNQYPLPQKTKSIPVSSALTLTALTGNNIAFTYSGSVLYSGWGGKWIIAKSPYRGRGIISGYTSATAGTINIVEAFSTLNIPANYTQIDGHGTGSLDPQYAGAEGRLIQVSSSESLFDNQIVDSLIEINGGVLRVTAKNSTSDITVEIVKIMDTNNSTTAWFLSDPEWQTAYPQTMAFFENRMFFGESTEKPGYIWGSEMHSLNSFIPGANDTCSLMYHLQGEESQKIQWMVGGKVLTIGTANGLWSIGQDLRGVPVTPENPMLNKLSSLPSAKIKPALMESSIIISQRNREKIFDIDAGSEGRLPHDLTIFSEPFTSTNMIVSIISQKTPQQVIWVLDSAGNMWGLNYNIVQEISSWFKNVTPNGEFESIAMCPIENGPDELWAVVKRTFGSSVIRTIEKKTIDQYMDCSKTYSGSSVSLLTGFTHFPEDTEVSVVTDEDGYIGEYDVNGSGQIDISPHSSASARAGLKYDAVLQTMNWGVISQGGKQSYSKLRRGVDINLSLLEAQSGSVACQVEQDGSVNYLDIFESTQSTPWSGTKEKNLLTGSGKEIYFYIKQDKPLPFSLLSISVEMK